MNSSILSSSFWIINQWDSLNQQEKEEEEKNFQEKIKDSHFKFNKNRFFKISALQYSLLRHIAEGTLERTEKRKKEVDTLNSIKSDLTDISSDQAKSLLETVEPVVEFSNFKEQLFTYLNTTAKNEFLASATNELLEMIQQLVEIISPNYLQYQHQKMEDFRSIKLESETRKELDKFIGYLKNKVDEFAKEIRTSEKIDFWTDDTQNKINHKIDTVLINSPELENKLRTGKYQNVDLSILPSILKKELSLPNILSEYLYSSIDGFMEKINNFSRELKLINRYYLPEKIIVSLEDKLGKRDIQFRLSGLADIIFLNLGDEFQRISLELKTLHNEKYQKDDEQNFEIPDENELIQSALAHYQRELTKYISELKNNTNRYINSSIKNHVEDLVEELPKLLNNDVNKDAIALKIRANIEKSKTIEAEIQKKEAITVAYQNLIELQQSL